MTTPPTSDQPGVAEPVAGTEIEQAAANASPLDTLKIYGKDYLQRVSGGETGSVPALSGLIVLTIFFSFVHSGFTSAYNIEALVVQAAPVIIMAMGLIFVLLLGEIDLSAGTTGGLCSALMAVMMVRHGQPWYLDVAAGIGVGIVIGAFMGWLRAKVRIPSFVITLATFLAFQGIVLIMVGGSGSITLTDNTVIGLEGLNKDFMPAWMAWTMLVVVTLGFAAIKLNTGARRRRDGLPAEPVPIVIVKTIALALLGAIFTVVMGQNRSTNSNAFFHTTSEGMPYSVLLVVILVFGWTYVLNKTRYGRHIYAVGGNEEAARRAGIRVDIVRISVFVICSGMAAVSGIVQASFSESVPSDAGAGNTLLLAVGAAVIGGTSLFGGRGRAVDAILGGLVVAMITNGMSSLIQGANSAGYEWIVTGGVLLLAAGFDAVSRLRSRAGT
jgi:D-xylose transport system permease protein